MILSLDLCAYLCTLLEKLETEQLGDHFVDFLFDFPDKTCPFSFHYQNSARPVWALRGFCIAFDS